VFLVESVLFRGRYHTAAVISAVHSGRKPYFFVFMLHTVNDHRRRSRMIMEQQTLYRNAGVIYGFVARFTQLVAHLTAIAVNTVADTVYEPIRLTFDIYCGKCLQIFVNTHRLVTDISADILEEIVSAARCIIIDRICKCNLFGIVDKPVQRSVAARNDNAFVLGHRRKKRPVITHFCHVGKSQLVAVQKLLQLFCRIFSFSVSGKRIVKHIVFCHDHSVPFRLFSIISRTATPTAAVRCVLTKSLSMTPTISSRICVRFHG